MINIEPRTLATMTANAHYRDLHTIADATDYFRAELMMNDDDAIISRPTLRTILDRDLHDMLHNANLDDLFPDLDDADADSAFDRLLHDDDYYHQYLSATTLILAARFSL